MSSVPIRILVAALVFSIGIATGWIWGLRTADRPAPSILEGKRLAERDARRVSPSRSGTGAVVPRYPRGEPARAASGTHEANEGAAAGLQTEGTTDAQHVLDALRRGADGAYRRYLVGLLSRLTLAQPGLEWDLVELTLVERGPGMLTALSEALTQYYLLSHDDRILDVAEDALAEGGSPDRRRVFLRSLGKVPGVWLALPGFVARCAELAAHAPDADTRQEAVGALIAQARTDVAMEPGFSDTLVDTATRAPDPEQAGRLLSASNLDNAGAEAIQQVVSLLGSDEPAIRRGAAEALGKGGVRERDAVLHALEDEVRVESEPEVRNTLLDALVRLGLQEARPALDRLRGIDPELDGRIEHYGRVLDLGINEWRLVQRESWRLGVGEDS